MPSINLHVVGCPRSGTTLMAEMLAACYANEGHSEHEESIFRMPPEHDGLYLSKQPNDALWVAPLLERDPGLHVIAMMRDPRAVVCSMHEGWPGMYFCNYPVWKRAERAIGEIGAHPHVLVIRYEDLVADPAAVQQRINEKFSFMRAVHAFTAFHEVAQSSVAARKALGGIRAVDTASVEGWRNHLPRLKRQLQLHPAMADDLLRHGYEPDSAWLSTLDNIDPRDFPCRYGESTPFFKNLEQRLRFAGKTRRYLRERGL